MYLRLQLLILVKKRVTIQTHFESEIHTQAQIKIRENFILSLATNDFP